MAKSRKLFLTDYALTPLERIPACGILCQQDRIIATGGATAFSLLEDGLEIHDFTDCYAVPGFIDSHVHGIDTFDATNPDFAEDTLAKMSQALVRHGVTSFCPTMVSRPAKEMLQIASTLAEMTNRGVQGADVAGVHVEGPFLNMEKRGSQAAEAILEKIDLGLAREIFEAGRGLIRIMTFAPELENADKLVELMLEHNVIPSMGHSLATEEQAKRCIDAGAHRCTYIFNGMPQLYHRESSLTSMALCDDRVAIEMISDGLHIHPRFVDLTTRCKPQNKIIGISNGVASHKLDTDQNEVVTTSDGIITGSTMTLENSWKHLISYAGMKPSLAASCFTVNPAANLGLTNRGELLPGRRADIVFFDLKTNQVRATVVRGEVIYRKT
ncbi:MAG: amidohydrolase family protein [Lentisphaeria bacterium]|nr:amidohydrolase family protein [Lentisphaeria bacterium]